MFSGVPKQSGAIPVNYNFRQSSGFLASGTGQIALNMGECQIKKLSRIYPGYKACSVSVSRITEQTPHSGIKQALHSGMEQGL